MDARQFLITAVVLALFCWLTLIAVVTVFPPEPVTVPVFHVLLGLGVSATVAPVVYFLHWQFGDARERPRWLRYARQSLWIGVLVAFDLWLYRLQALSTPALLLGICVVALLELVVLRPSRSGT